MPRADTHFLPQKPTPNNHHQTCEAKYDTRLRIFQSSKDANTYAMAFRPTQMNPMVRALLL